MGMDEALLESARAGGAPTLRLYRWRGPWLSLGYSQKLDPQREQACRVAGVGVVQRVTGGRAVLHGSDLTYALAAPDSALPQGLAASYAVVCDALLAALRSLGVAADASQADLPTPDSGQFDCFAQPAPREICVGGRKLAGSAQRRVPGGILQHGSIRIAPDPQPVSRACALVPGAATDLLSVLGPGVNTEIDSVSSACVEAFAAELDCAFERSKATPQELDSAARRHAQP